MPKKRSRLDSVGRTAEVTTRAVLTSHAVGESQLLETSRDLLLSAFDGAGELTEAFVHRARQIVQGVLRAAIDLNADPRSALQQSIKGSLHAATELEVNLGRVALAVTAAAQEDTLAVLAELDGVAEAAVVEAAFEWPQETRRRLLETLRAIDADEARSLLAICEMHHLAG